MLWIAEWVSVGSGSRRLEVSSHFYWLILGKISKSTNFRFLFSGMGKKTHSVFFPVHCEDEVGFQFGESFLKRLPRALLSKVISCSQLPDTYMWLMDHFHFILPFPNIFPNVSKSQLPSAFPRNLQQVLIFPLQKKKKGGVGRPFCQETGFLAARNGQSVLSIVRVVYSTGFEVEIFRSKSSYSTFTNPVT